MIRARLLLPLAALLLAGCSTSTGRFGKIDSCLSAGQAWNYRGSQCEPVPNGPVDFIRVHKAQRLLSAYRGGVPIREFRVALGVGGVEDKQQQGDGRVPGGRYLITAHNPNSAYHRSLRIGYPTLAQAEAARARGVSPGGDIMIHGLPNGRGSIGSRHTLNDWTDGCIALANPEVEWLYAAVRDGTPIEILP